MNRRELLQAVVGVAAASGVTVKGSAVDADVKPALVLFEVDEFLDEDQGENIVLAWRLATQGTSFEGTKALVLGKGMRVTMLDANGRPLNHRLDAYGRVLRQGEVA